VLMSAVIAQAPPSIGVIPQPVQVSEHAGRFALRKTTVI